MLRRSFALLVAAGQGPFDPYKILGVEPGASKQDIKRAYHRLALRFHPDGGPEGNAERFNAVHEAYEALKDGKWKPTAEQQQSTMRDGQGWDPKMRMYVYEKPGSTTENYVNSHTQTVLRLVMVWCLLFVVVRFFLMYVFPNTRAPGSVMTEDASLTNVSSRDGSASVSRPSLSSSSPARSVHDEDDQEAAWSLNSHLPKQPSGATTLLVDEVEGANTTVDPLAGRHRVY